MSAPAFSPRIGIYGPEVSVTQQSRGCSLWAVGYAAAVTAAEATPVALRLAAGSSWDDLLEELDAVVFTGGAPPAGARASLDEALCDACRELGLPFLGVDRGMHVLNTAFGGTLHVDLPRELPQALQHQLLPEEGDRHAINVVNGTRLSMIYGEGEIVVNSEHRSAVARVARGFRVSATALDGVIEAIEPEGDDWFALGVQWNPASASASGLDIQLFRGLVEACHQRRHGADRKSQLVAA
jgi:putative glutamine amidotransferase